jgi:uncharacterized protein YcfL
MRTLWTILALGAIVMAFGCGHGPYAAKGYAPGTTSIEHTNRVIVTGAGLSSHLRVVQMNATVLDDGRLKVYAEIENRTGGNLVVQIQTQFKDAAGVLLQDETNWKTVVMPPHSSTSYDATSMNGDAKDYVIRIKPEKV